MSLYKEEKYSLWRDYKITHITAEYSGIKIGFPACQKKKKLEIVFIFLLHFMYHGPDRAALGHFTGVLKYMAPVYFIGLPPDNDANVSLGKQEVNPSYIMF